MGDKVSMERVALRRATWGDFPMVLGWKRLPHICETAVGDANPPDELKVREWYSVYMQDAGESRCFMRIIELDSSPVGYVIVWELDTDTPKVGICIADKRHWGIGLAEIVIKRGWEYFRRRGYSQVSADVRPGNFRSSSLLRKVGLEQVGSTPEKVEYVKSLGVS